MSPSNTNRNSGRQPETPQRVANAAEQMRNTAAHGNFRGYVPQQTGSQQPMGRNPSMQPGTRAAGYMNPMYRQQTQQPVYHAVPQAAGGQRGFGMPAMQQKPKKKHRVWLYLLLAVLIIGMIAGGTYYGIKLSKEAEARKMQLDVKAKNFETAIFTATDTQGFAEKSVPTLAVTTGLKSPYHKPEDDAELIDYQGMDKITSYMADVTECFANQPGELPSGKIAAIHGGKKKSFEIGPSVSLVNGSISFPDAAFNGKVKYGFDAGLAAQARLSNSTALEVKALYEYVNAQYPDEGNLYASSLPYHQEAVLAPVNLLF